MSQLSYQTDFDPAFEGQMADSNLEHAVSKIAEGADNSILFGKGVALGSGEDQVVALAAITDVFAGVVMHKHIEEGIIKAGEALSLMRKGRIHVKVEEAVDAGDPVFVRAVATGAEEAGSFRKTADGTDTIDLSSFARFSKGAGAGELAILDINMP